jgi:hypothetical protein
MKPIRHRTAAIATGILLLLGCGLEAASGNEMNASTSIRYFRSFDAVRFPYQPYDEIEEESTRDLDAFVRCEFDSRGRIARLEKFYKGHVHFSHQYQYHPSGAIREVVIREFWPREVPVRVRTFDEAGRPTGEQ